MKEQIIRLVGDHFANESGALSLAFQRFPKPGTTRMVGSFRERKYTSKYFDRFDPLMHAMPVEVQMSPTGKDYFTVTTCSARPGQPARRLPARAGQVMRKSRRILILKGLGKQDVYRGPNQ